MYKKQLTLFVLIVFFATALLGMMILYTSDKDYDTYQKLLESSNPNHKPLLSFTEQNREGVCKEIWYEGPCPSNSPLYFRIESDDSQLFFFHQDKGIEIIEKLGPVRCFIQEELYYEKTNGKPMQLLRYMEAKEARYNYNTQDFIAQEVKLWRYRLEGHEPILDFTDYEPLMSALAHEIEFVIKGKQLDFHANRFYAKFNEEIK